MQKVSFFFSFPPENVNKGVQELVWVFVCVRVLPDSKKLKMQEDI